MACPVWTPVSVPETVTEVGTRPCVGPHTPINVTESLTSRGEERKVVWVGIRVCVSVAVYVQMCVSTRVMLCTCVTMGLRGFVYAPVCTCEFARACVLTCLSLT